MLALAEAELEEYLAEIREHVCSQCVERPPGGPPCGPVGKECGVELHLAKLVDSIHDVESPLMAPYLEHNRKDICGNCALLHSNICPCPMDYLAGLIVEAVERVDLSRRQGNQGRKPFTSRAGRPPGMVDIRRIHEEAKGAWTGCDWATRFGKSGLDLNGWTAAQAEARAQETVGAVGEDWLSAARWLGIVELHARLAETEAMEAVAAAQAGAWCDARRHAVRAWILEFTTGRPLRHGFPVAWQRLRQVIEEAASAQEPKSSESLNRGLIA
jgi:hypothetical protein